MERQKRNDIIWLVGGGVMLAAVFAGIINKPPTASPVQRPMPTACAISQFEVKDASITYISGDYARVEGTVRSLCPDLARITITWLVRNPDGSYSKFPIMTRRAIYPNQAWPFDTVERIPPNRPSSTVEITAIE